MLAHDEIVRRLKYHKVTDPSQMQVMDTVRSQFLTTAIVINDLLPSCREASLALTKLEEASMWAIAAIARPVPGTAMATDARLVPPLPVLRFTRVDAEGQPIAEPFTTTATSVEIKPCTEIPCPPDGVYGEARTNEDGESPCCRG